MSFGRPAIEDGCPRIHRGFASPFMHCNSDDVKIASPATKTNYISMMSRQSFDQVNELTWLIFLE